MKKKCVCGEMTTTRPCNIKSGRAKFCSNCCKYKYRIRSKGLKDKVIKVNNGWFKKGVVPWSKNRKGIQKYV